MAGRTAPQPKEDTFEEKLGKARAALATELVTATDLDAGGGMDVVYAERLAGVLHTLHTLREI